MSDWAPGDLALCVKTIPEAVVAKAGMIFTVAEAGWYGDYFALWFEGYTKEYNWLPPSEASRFRKIPPHEADAEDRETIRLLTGKPVPVEA